MSVAALYNIPSTPQEWAEWSFSNAAHHRDLFRVIFQNTGQELQEYSIDPIDPNDVGAWIYQHQQMHNQQNAVLGISGYDLTDVDFKDKEQLAGWIELHSNEHLQAAAILNLG